LAHNSAPFVVSFACKVADVNTYERDGATFLVELSQGHEPPPLDDGLQRLPVLGMVHLLSVEPYKIAWMALKSY
jgi:hypothetical protein